MIHYLDTLKRTMKDGWSDKAICDWHGKENTFREVAEQIEKLHIVFADGGIEKGDKIALCANNSANWAISFLAVNTFGAVVVPLLSNFTPENICNLVDHSESKLLLTDKEIWDTLDTGKMNNLRAALSLEDFSLLWSGDKAICNAVSGAQAKFAEKHPHGLTKDDVHYDTDNDKLLAVINYTSGTTSDPKGVMLRYECLSASIDFAIRNFKCGRGDTILSMLPMGHIYGLVFEFLFPLCNGVTVYYLGKTPSASTLMSAVAEVKPVIVITVPLVMEKIYKSSLKGVLSKKPVKLLSLIPGINTLLYRTITRRFKNAFGGKVTQFVLGGAALNPEVEKGLATIGIPFTVGYGMTEASPLLTYSDPSVFVPGTCGKAVDTITLRIDSEDPHHIPGEIQARGLNICSGYYKNQEASANAFTADGYLHTGDLGTIDSNGNITLRGRCKNMILTANGQNVYPEEVEAVVNAQKYVVESVVVDRSSRIVALAYLNDLEIKKDGLSEETLSKLPERIRMSCNRLLPKFSQLSKVELVKSPFKKTPKMSIKRFLYK